MQKVTPQIWGKNSSMNFRTLVFTADFFEQATMIEATGCPEIRQSVLHPCASAWLLWSAMFFTMLKASESALHSHWQLTSFCTSTGNHYET